MSTFPSHSNRGNLEPVGPEIRGGAWRISPLIDLVSEKQFLLFQLRSRAHLDLVPSALRFRGDAAVLMAPDRCPGVLSATIEAGRVELLTDYHDVITRDSVQGETLPELFEALFETLAVFERHHYQCGDLFPETMGWRSDTGFVLLPNAYIFPFAYGEIGPTTSADLREELAPTRQRAIERPYDIDIALNHALLLRKFITQLLDAGTPDRRSDALPAFQQRLLDASDAIKRGEITSIGPAYKKIYDKTLGTERPQPPSQRAGSETEPAIEACVDRVLDQAGVEGSVIVIHGDSCTSKSGILRRAAALLDGSDAFTVYQLDEWDLFTKSWKKTTQKGKSRAHAVWMIDDIDEKALAYSDFASAMLESHTFPKGSVVVSVCPERADGEVSAFLQRLDIQRGDLYQEIATREPSSGDEAGRLAAFLRSAIALLDPALKTGAKKPPGELVCDLLEYVGPECKQLLEFLAVARFAMPLDLVLSVFSETGAEARSAIVQLARLECIELSYKRVPPKNLVSLFLRIDSTALRRLIYESIAPRRRGRLHRTVALLAEREDSFPKYLLLFHCLKSEATDLAAKHAVAYLKETRSEKRHPNLVSLCVALAKKKQLDKLPFAERVLATYELSVDLLRYGRGDEAEKLLERSLALINKADEDDKLRNAPRVSDTFRLLADRWEARGEFKRAKNLLEMAREDLQSALPIPEQAQLLNDIGWLQYRLGDYEKSMESCRLSLNTLSANQYPIIVSQALNLMGVVHFNTSRYDEAVSYYEQSADLRERANDENALAASFNNLALAYQSKGEFEKAFDYHNKSLRLKKRQNNKAGIAAGYLNLAFLHLEGRNFQEAEAKCRESLIICEELGNAQLAADNYTTLGDIALEYGDFEKADHHYRESIKISHQREAINEEMGALRRLSSLCIKRGRFEEAREHAQAALKLVERIGSRYETAQIEMTLGDLEREQNRNREALDYYENASNKFTSLSKYRLAATVLSKTGLVHARTGNQFEAKHCLERAQEFVRADIGRELPEEFLQLRHALQAHPGKSLLAGGESQKLLMAFYDLSALTDYVMDCHEFLRRILAVTKQVVDPIDCCIALKTPGDRFVLFDAAAERDSNPPKGLCTLFGRTLLLGGLLDSASPDIVDIVPSLKLSKGTAFACVPLKAMSEELGCLLFYLAEERLPLSKQDIHFLTWLGRQIAGSLKLMLHLNEDFVRDDPDSQKPDIADRPRTEYRFENLIGKTEAMKKIFRTLEKVRDTDAGILILGESGTGKSVLARATHHNSPRRHRPFQEIHCAQIPYNLLESELFGHERGSFTGAVQRKPGLCELADGGTLFLDDINVIPVETQTKLLHFLESKSFMRLGGTQRLHSDVRIIAASNEDLEDLCRQGKFREDLYYRLKVILIELPPLRERKDDMLAIAVQYLKRSCAEKGLPLKTLSPETVELFRNAPWRGNVRELQNVLERVVVLSDENVITPSTLPEDFAKEIMGTSRQSRERLDVLVEEIVKLGTYSEANPLLPTLEALLAKRMVSYVKGKSRAAGMLGISKPTLYARLRDYDKLR